METNHPTYSNSIKSPKSLILCDSMFILNTVYSHFSTPVAKHPLSSDNREVWTAENVTIVMH